MFLEHFRMTESLLPTNFNTTVHSVLTSTEANRQFTALELMERFSRTINELVLDFDSEQKLIKVFDGKASELRDSLRLQQGITMVDLFDSRAYVILCDAIEKALDTEEITKVEFEHKLANQTFLLRVKVAAKVSEGGTLITLFVKDITRIVQRNREQTKLIEINEKLQNKILKNLEKSEQVQRSLIESLPDTILIVNPKGLVVDIQNAHKVDWIFPKGNSFALRSLASLMLEPAAIEHLLHLCDFPFSNKSTVELKHLEEDLFLEVRATPLFKNQVMLVLRDATDRVRNQRKIEESQAMLSALYNSAKEAMLLVNRSLDIIWCNKAGEAYASQVSNANYQIGQGVTSFFNQSIPDDFILQSIEKAFEGNQVLERREVEHTENVSMFVDLEFKPVVDQNKSIFAVAISMMDCTAKVISERALSETMMELSVIKSASDLSTAVMVLDTQGIILKANDIACDITGYSSPHLKGISLHSLAKSESAKLLIKLYAQIKRGDIWSGEIHIMNHSGNDCWLDTTIVPIVNPEGELVELVTFSYDITAKKAHEEAIITQKSRIESLINNTEDLILAVDTHHRIIVCNESYKSYIKRKFGVNLKEGDLLTEYLSSTEKEEFTQHALRALKGEIFTIIVEKTNNQNKTFYWEISYSPVVNKGKPNGITLFIKDITFRKQSELQLKAQKTLLEEVINTAPNLISLSDDEGKYKIVSKSVCDLLGLEQEQIIGKTHDELRDIVHSSTGKIWISKPLHAFAGEGKEEVRLPLHNGQSLFFDIINKPMITSDGDFQLLKIGTNITDRKQAMKSLLLKNEELSEANDLLEKINAELDKFVYSASHNLRAPLTSIMGLISLMRLEGNTSSYLNLMEKSIQRLDGFITDIISYSKNARQEVLAEPIDFDALFRAAFEDLAFFNPNPKLSLQISVKSTERPFVSDAKRLEMILINLISNAFKYHNFDQALPYIKASVEADEKNAKIIIEDNGQGIEKQHHAKVFKMFYRATEGSEGSGIGLYIVKEVVEKLKGTIHLESSPGVGTTFTIHLPSTHSINHPE